MPAGTLYLYHSRAGASLNLSAEGEGDAVLIKAAMALGGEDAIATMQRLNPLRSGALRPRHRLCSGQALLCRALDLRVREWTGRRFDPTSFWLEEGVGPDRIVQTRRLDIPDGRDGHLPYRFVHAELAASATGNPLTKRSWAEGRDYWIRGRTEGVEPSGGG